jgi:hypothetical protein
MGEAGEPPIELIPRMRGWIEAHCPGIKLAITEYRWGRDNGISSALAQAEVLAIFGREGVDAASRWGTPQAGSRLEDAFHLYLNYDGQGGRLLGESVRAESSDVDTVAAYAIINQSEIYVLLFNKSIQAQQVTVTGDLTISGPIALYGCSSDQSYGPMGTVELSGNDFMVEIPARSARLAVGSGVEP